MAFGGEILTGKWHTGGSQELEAVYVLIRVAVTQVYIHIYIYIYAKNHWTVHLGLVSFITGILHLRFF